MLVLLETTERFCLLLGWASGPNLFSTTETETDGCWLVWMMFGSSSSPTRPSSWLGMGCDAGLSRFSGEPGSGTAVPTPPSVSVLFILLGVSVVGVIGDVASLATSPDSWAAGDVASLVTPPGRSRE